MDQFGSEGDPITRDQFGVCQVNGQDRIVFLHIRAQQEERCPIQPQLELRQKTCVVEIEAVGIASTRYDIAPVIKQRKGVTGFECARPALLEGDVRLDVKRRRFLIAGRIGGRRGLAGIAARNQAASR